MTYLLLISASIFALIIGAFAVQNSVLVNVDLFVWNIQTTLALVVLGAACLGFLSALTLGLVVQLKLRFQYYKAEQRIKFLEQSLETIQAGSSLPAENNSIPRDDVL